MKDFVKLNKSEMKMILGGGVDELSDGGDSPCPAEVVWDCSKCA